MTFLMNFILNKSNLNKYTNEFQDELLINIEYYKLENESTYENSF